MKPFLLPHISQYLTCSLKVPKSETKLSFISAFPPKAEDKTRILSVHKTPKHIKTDSACLCVNGYEFMPRMTVGVHFCVSHNKEPSIIFIDQNNVCSWSADRRAWQAAAEMWPTADKKAFHATKRT